MKDEEKKIEEFIDSSQSVRSDISLTDIIKEAVLNE